MIETVETVSTATTADYTQLKQGVNERSRRREKSKMRTIAAREGLILFFAPGSCIVRAYAIN